MSGSKFAEGKFSITDNYGNVYVAQLRWDSNWSFQGWNIYKNNSFLEFIPTEVSFIHGDGNIIVTSDEQAVRVAMVREVNESNPIL